MLKTTVCVKLLDALAIFTVTELEPFTLTDAVTLLMVDALAMVLKTPLPEAVTLP